MFLKVVDSYSNGKYSHFINKRHTEKEGQVTSIGQLF